MAARTVQRDGRHRRRPAVGLGAALRGRRRLRIGSIQAAYILGALGLGLIVPYIPVGLTVESSRATEMLFAVGAAFVPFLGITYSLLFLVAARRHSRPASNGRAKPAHEARCRHRSRAASTEQSSGSATTRSVATLRLG